MRRGEAKGLLWIGLDTERLTLTLNNPEKTAMPEYGNSAPQLIAQLNALPKDSEKIFGDSRMDSLKMAFLRLRHKQAEKLKNPRLLRIGFCRLFRR